LILFEARDLAADAHVAMHVPGACHYRAFEFFQHLDFGVINSVGIVISLDAHDVCLSLLVIEALHGIPAASWR
jgi:hypothetical protein